MKAIKLMALGVVPTLTCMLVGCGPSAAERAAQAQRRLEFEAQAQRDAQKANAAITTMNQKLGRKPPQLDLGVAPKTTEAAPGQPRQR